MVTRFKAPARAMEWVTTKVNFLTVPGFSTVVTLDEPIQRKGATVTRCVVSLSLIPPLLVTQFAWGTIVLNTAMADANKPDPFLPANVGWLCWDFIEVQNQAAGGVGFHRQYDMRSQRRYRSDVEQLFLIIRSNQTIDGSMGVRTLFKLP